jgi:non-specific serine/threonine protein kinase/serine/threonine-protein kinase
MDAEFRRVKELFLAALEQGGPDERAAFLGEACGADEALRRQVQALLERHEEAGGFLEQPAGGPLPTEGSQPGQFLRHSEVDRTAPAEAVGGRVGPYKLLQKLGEGGMGAVWVAEQEQPVKRRVALKVIKPGMDSAQVLRRFEAERQALALMDHTSIAKVFDAGSTPEGRPYFVMELVKGEPITKYCDTVHLPIRERLGLFSQVCQAIQHAHQKGVIHRDVKPSNVLVCMQDGKPVPKVIDFGVAKALHHKLTDRTLYTEVGAVVGTLEYMSPEQAELSALDIDTRADVYSLGALLYELLTGSTPLDKKRLRSAAFTEMLRIIKEEEPPRPSTRLTGSKESLAGLAVLRRTEPARLTKEVRGELDWIVMKALEKDRTRRYQTANGLARDVECYLADEPVEACPPGAGYRLRKLLRKHRAAVGTAAALLALLVTGAAVSALQAVRATRAEALAVAAEAEARKQAKEAQDKLALSAAVTAFLQNDLLGQAGSRAQADRRFEPDYNLTVKEALDRAAVAVGNRFKDRPELEASIRQTMGDAYREVGDYERAIAQLQQAAAIRKGKLGPDHPDLFTTLTSLALAFEAAGKTTEAIALLEQVHDAQAKKNGPDHPDTLVALGNLANAYRAAGRAAQAVALLKQVRDAQVRWFGPDHPSTLTTLGLLALAYRDVGDMTEAVALLQQVRVARARDLGPHHPDTLETFSNLAEALRIAGKTTEATALLEQVRDARVKDLGPDHPDTLLTLNHLAAAYWQAKKHDQSIPLLEQTLAVMRKKLGEQHPQTLRTQANLGVLYRDDGRLEEALPLLEQAHRQANTHALLRWVGARLATVYVRTGRREQAAALVKENLEAARRWQPADSLPLATALADNGSALLELQAWADAEPVLRESLAVREKKQPDAWTTFDTQSMLGQALLGQKKHAAAEPLLLRGYGGMKQRADKVPPIHQARLTEALERLVRLYEATGQKEKAAEWRKQLEEAKAAPKKPTP